MGGQKIGDMGGRKLRGVAAKFQLGECARPGEEARQSQSDVTRSGRLITKLELVHGIMFRRERASELTTEALSTVRQHIANLQRPCIMSSPIYCIPPDNYTSFCYTALENNTPCCTFRAFRFVNDSSWNHSFTTSTSA